MKKNKLFALGVSVCMIILLLLSSCGDDSASSAVIPNPFESAQTASYEVIEPTALGDTLTAEFEGDWLVSSVYQNARYSDKSPEEALAEEQSKAIHLGSDFFESNTVRLDVPYYKITKATKQDLQDSGISLTKVDEDFGEETSCIEVYEQDGETLRQKFFVKGESLVFEGSGMYVFECQKVMAVG